MLFQRSDRNNDVKKQHKASNEEAQDIYACFIAENSLLVQGFQKALAAVEARAVAADSLTCLTLGSVLTYHIAVKLREVAPCIDSLDNREDFVHARGLSTLYSLVLAK